MKKSATFKFLVLLCCSTLSFSSCDTIQSLRYDDVSIRFKNISTVDIDDISVLELNIETLAVDETTEYFKLEDVMIDEDGQPLFFIMGNIEGQRYSNGMGNPSSIIACFVGADDRDVGELLKNGQYTLTINVAGEYVEEGRNENIYLITALHED